MIEIITAGILNVRLANSVYCVSSSRPDRTEDFLEVFQHPDNDPVVNKSVDVVVTPIGSFLCGTWVMWTGREVYETVFVM
uniref:Uncharacterized protein n=1 Tax=Steinernema glaseri TaxID=37863 RepID=A0A1I7ZQN0_9BILA